MPKTIIKTLAAGLVMLFALSPQTRADDYVTSITSGKYYRIVSAFTGLSSPVALYASYDGTLLYKQYDATNDAENAHFIFKVTDDGTYRSYDAYSIQNLETGNYIYHATNQSLENSTTATTDDSNYFIKTSADAWQVCILHLYDDSQQETNQFLIEPGYGEDNYSWSSCVGLNGTAATEGNIITKLYAWSANESPKINNVVSRYGNSQCAWYFEPVDDSVAEKIIAQKEQSYTTSITSGGYYRIVSSCSGLSGNVALYASEDGYVKYKSYDAATDGNNADFIFKVTGNGTYNSYDAYSIQNLKTNNYIYHATNQSLENSTTATTDDRNYFIKTSADAWQVCILHLYDSNQQETNQFLIEPGYYTDNTNWSSCVGLNGNAATEGNTITKLYAWGANQTPKENNTVSRYGNSQCSWYFEPVDEELAEKIANTVRATSITSGNYYRIVSTCTELTGKVALYASEDGYVKYKSYDAATDENNTEFIFKVTSNGTYNSYDAYSIQNLKTNNYIYHATNQSLENSTTGTTDDSDYFIQTSPDAWQVCILHLYDSNQQETNQFLIEPGYYTDNTNWSSCVGLNGTAATGGNTITKLYAWGANQTPREHNTVSSYGNSQCAWYFEPVDVDVYSETDNIVKALGVITAEGLKTTLETENNFSAVDLSDATLAADLTADNLTAILPANVVAIVPATSDIKGTNIINNGTCEELKLTDGNSFAAPQSEFTANAVTYDRNMTTNWGTIYLPYAVSPSTNLEFFVVKGVSSDAITVESVEALSANTPALVHKVGNSNTISLGLNSATTITGAQGTSGSEIANAGLVGVYKRTQIAEDDTKTYDYYYLNGDAFNHINQYFYATPFRAYLRTTGAIKSPSFKILVDDDPTGINNALNDGGNEIEGVYSVSGVKQSTLKKGINIVRYRNGKTQKVILK